MLQTGRLFTDGLNTAHAGYTWACRMSTRASLPSANRQSNLRKELSKLSGIIRFVQSCILSRRLSEVSVRLMTVNTLLTDLHENTSDIHVSRPLTSTEGMED